MSTLKWMVAALVASAGPSYAQFPEKAVTIIVPFAPGGGTDGGARALAQALSTLWGQPVVVENRPGAAGSLGATYVSQAEPDGYTLLMGNFGTQVINPILYEDLSYDPQEDFEPISVVADLPLLLVAHPDFPVETVQDLIDRAKADPGGITYSSSGIGGSLHVAAALFEQMSGIELYHIPYNGGGPAMQDLIGGHVDIAFPTLLEASSLISGGMVRPLGVTRLTPLEQLPDVPTISSVVDGYHSESWLALLAPGSTPDDIVESISSDIKALLSDPELARRLEAQGAFPVGSTPEELRQLVARETERHRQLFVEANINLE